MEEDGPTGRHVGTGAAPRPRSGRVRRDPKPAHGVASKAAGVASGATSAASAKVSRAQAFASAHRLTVIVAASVLAAVVMLYGPACDLYAAWRSGLDLQATYDATAQSNDQLTSEVDALMTPEGVQDLAREHGYVGEGETGVVVEGLSDSSTDAAPMGTGTTVLADVPWYVGAADVIFQYRADSSGGAG